MRIANPLPAFQRAQGHIARRRVALMSALALAVSLNVVTPPPAEALMKAHCKPEVGYGFIDPVVYHGVSGPTGHNHTFFANQKLLTLPNPNAANYADLSGAATTCQNTDDTAAYWIPTLLYKATGKPVPLNAMISYYRTFDHKDTGVAEPLPADLRMVGGNAKATGPQDVRHFNWTCNMNSSRKGPYISPEQANCAAATGSVVRLTAHVDFPSCWDGTMNDHSITGNTADFSGTGGVVNHLAYAKGSICPAGFPRKLAEVRFEVNWNYTGNGKDVMLSSDPVGGPYGYTLHGDIWNTWIQTGGKFGGMVGMVQNCVNKKTGSSTVCG